MQAARQRVYGMVDAVPYVSQLDEIAAFITFIKMRDDGKLFQRLEVLSESSTGFWHNDIDDEVWNHA